MGGRADAIEKECKQIKGVIWNMGEGGGVLRGGWLLDESDITETGRALSGCRYTDSSSSAKLENFNPSSSPPDIFLQPSACHHCSSAFLGAHLASLSYLQRCVFANSRAPDTVPDIQLSSLDTVHRNFRRHQSRFLS